MIFKNKKYFKGRNNRILQALVIVLLLGICLPLFLEFFIWRNSFPSVLDNSDWSSFLGSYLGGIIGGFATLLSVRFTLLETRKDYYKDFLTQMIDISALYIDDIRKYKIELSMGKSLYRDICELQEDISTIQKDINLHNAPNRPGIEDELCRELQEKKEEIRKIQNNQKDYILILQDIENRMRHNYIILDINLRDLSIGNDFLAKTKKILETVSMILVNIKEYDRYDEYIDQLCEEDFISKTNGFVENYKQMYLI